MAREKILVVDDEADILELVSYNLSKDGFQVIRAQSGEDAVASAQSEIPDLILLDIMLPGIDGLDVCRAIRRNEKTKSIPIIFLTAKGEEADVVAGLELGADDYLVKPFSPRVLLARAKAILRRNHTISANTDDVVQIDGISIDPKRHEVKLSDEQLELTSTEFKLLHHLARHPGYVFTRAQLVDAVHGDDYPVTDRSVDVQVVGLRRKLGDFGGLVETVRGVGYRFKG